MIFWDIEKFHVDSILQAHKALDDSWQLEINSIKAKIDQAEKIHDSYEYIEYLGNQWSEIEDWSSVIVRNALFQGLWSFFEDRVNQLAIHGCSYLKATKKLQSYPGNGVRRALDCLNDSVGLPTIANKKTYDTICVLNDFRNAIVHRDGRLKFKENKRGAYVCTEAHIAQYIKKAKIGELSSLSIKLNSKFIPHVAKFILDYLMWLYTEYRAKEPDFGDSF